MSPRRALTTERLVLEAATPAHAEGFAEYLGRNREHFAASSPLGSARSFHAEYWRERFGHQDAFELRFLIRRRTGTDVVGDCAFSQIVRGPFQACYLGYRLDAAAVGQGIMAEALGAAIAYAFGELKLHRIMANHVPTNERSGRLLRRLGFVVEGYARDYLYLGGAWRDHVLTSLTNPAAGAPAIL